MNSVKSVSKSNCSTNVRKRNTLIKKKNNANLAMNIVMLVLDPQKMIVFSVLLHLN
jgi:hypothetical protein